VTTRVLHVTADEAGARLAATLRQQDETVGAASEVVSALADEASGFEASCLAAARAFALAPGDAPDVVVAHGWPAVVAGERIASERGAALVTAGEPPLIGGEHAELAEWAAAWVDLLWRTAEGPVDPAAFRAALDSAKDRRGGSAEAMRIYDVLVRPDGLSEALVDSLLRRTQRFALQKGGTREDWRTTCARTRVALLSAAGPGVGDLVDGAVAAGCLPIVVGSPAGDLRAVAADEGGALDTVFGWLSDRAGLARRVALGRDAIGTAPTRAAPPPRNHGGLVADELRDSLAPLGWELRPLLGAGRDPLLAADVLVVFPYGDPRGALAAIRRANRVGVPTVFWNVEDPRYYFDHELGPLVRAAAQEATATFSTTRQLAQEYAAYGVRLHYLPNFGRGHFRVETPLRDDERTTDVVFLGMLTPDRRRFLEEYRAALGPDVAVAVRDDVRDPDHLRALVASSRLGLSVGTMTDAVGPGRPIRGEGLTERLFDYPLAGTPVLSDARGHLAETFVEGEDVLVFRDVDSAVAVTRAALADPARRAALAASARRKVLAEHLGRHRLLSIVEILAGRPDASPVLAAAAEAARARLARDLTGGVA
jgi:hypothetical protein